MTNQALGTNSIVMYLMGLRVRKAEDCSLDGDLARWKKDRHELEICSYADKYELGTAHLKNHELKSCPIIRGS